MRTADFQAEVTRDGQIAVPPEVASQLGQGEKVQVSLRWGSTEDEDWKAAGRKSFAAAYDPDDTVYELLADDSAT
ncbi:MAG TPA: hypothetical protein VHA14_08695 [Bryobacteraceae bacterium]|nr:hypothetical protein [Bryobacteraceae bacterium]